ncbi:hypothetical protein H2202_010593 [Exophiala xenobiotica]|nr:hypothetical protein H2202_010593 [Exophiala xenobiotica]KAK5212370.1 hypothetical protein LTR41_002612 [Exophiala xenobiotica]KAK5220825.1 hypothetical protein LTR47_011135 [Exophiala xenobiotica]KAK5252506.1 hypothetical protein LTS06_002913 [Exophiala xenobiotica]KAK5321864.1 hypothetical protein LTR93_006102 [Exophiala xenobiotica]
MDPVSITVSIVSLIDASYRLCDFISDVKEGGKERMKLLKEVSNLCCTLDTLKERFDGSQKEALSLSRTLGKDDGPIQQCDEIINSLTKTLTSSKHAAGRLVQQLKWNFDKREVLQAIEQLHRLQATITQAVQQAMFTVVDKIQQDGSTTLGIVEEKHSQEIRDWLSPLNFLAQQQAIQDSHCRGTGSKFLKSDEFHDFKRSTDSIMWCRGPPGAGKTYMSSIIAHHLQKEIESKGAEDIVLVVYCRYDDPACQVVTNILGGLLKQCLTYQRSPRQLPESLLNLHKVHTMSGTKPTSEELVAILAELCGRFRRCLITIDALDEFGESKDRISLLNALALLRQSLGDGVPGTDADTSEPSTAPKQCCISLLIMSRHFHDIELVLRTAWVDDHGGQSPSTKRTYELSPNEDDIHLYLDWRIENDPSLKALTSKRVGLRDEVLEAILKGSGSLFLLTKLMIDDIASCLTVKELKSSLQRLYTGLKVAYDATMQRIRRQGEGRTHRALEVMKWIIFAERPLTCAEIEHAVIIESTSTDIDVDDLVSAPNLAALCGGLVVIDQHNRFRFAHQTVSEYLRTNHADAFDDQSQSIADCCLTYLMYDEFLKGPSKHVTEFRDRLSRYPLYAYCSQYWYSHMPGGPTPDQSSEPRWRSSRQAARFGPTEDEIMLPHARLWGDVMLHHASYLNAHHLFDELYDMDRSVLNRRNELGRTPLMRSAVAGSLQFVKRLINVGADINVRDIHGDAALDIALWARDIRMVKLLYFDPSIELERKVETRSGGGTTLC